jgi:capsular exopolysaccharide synthesis family protein
MDDEIEFAEYFRMIRRDWLVAFAIFLLIFGTATVYTVLSPREYQATSSVLISATDPVFATSIRVDTITEAQIIESSNVRTPDLGSGYRLDAIPVKDTDIILIRVWAGDAQRTADLSNRLADNFVALKLQMRKEEARVAAVALAPQIAQTKADLEDLNRQLVALNSTKSPEYNAMKSVIAGKQRSYGELVSKLERWQVIASSDQNVVQVLDRASTPRAPVNPNAFKNLSIGAGIGMLLALVVVVIRNQNYLTAADIEDKLGPVLGTLPHSGMRGLTAYRAHDHEPNSAFAMHVKSIVAALPDTHLLSVVSAKAGDGKSMVASNIALALALQGKRTLLVDANLHNPIMHRVYALKDKEPGLTDVILEGAKLDSVIKIRKTTHENLFLLTAGKTTLQAIEQLASERIKDICNKLRSSNFDYVIFDNASLEHYEAKALASCSDAVLFVIREKIGKDQLVKPKANVIGVVINKK